MRCWWNKEINRNIRLRTKAQKAGCLEAIPNIIQNQDRIERGDYYKHIASKMFGVPEENITPAMRKAAKKEPPDPHIKAAARMFGIDPSTVTPEQRQFAQEAMFCYRYGGSGVME